MDQLDTLGLIQSDMSRNGKRRWHGANIRFDYETKLDQRKTDETGIPQYREIEVVFIQYPGGDEHVKKVDEHIKQEYADLYNAWKANQEPPTEGYPLKEWALLTKAEVKTFTELGFKTVEQLAECPDNVKKRLLTLSEKVKDAQEFLKAKDAKPIQVTNLKKKVEKLEKKNEQLTEKIELLMQRISATEGVDFK